MASTMELLDMFSEKFSKKILDIFAKKKDIPGTMKGAGKEEAGKSGLVPVPQAGQQGMYLRGDGTWQEPIKTDSFQVSTQEYNGLMSAGDKKKLDEITEGDTADIDSIIAGTYGETDSVPEGQETEEE